MLHHPINPESRPYQSENDKRLLEQTRKTIDRSRQLLAETEPLTDPHRCIMKRRRLAGDARTSVEEI